MKSGLASYCSCITKNPGLVFLEMATNDTDRMTDLTIKRVHQSGTMGWRSR